MAKTNNVINTYVALVLTEIHEWQCGNGNSEFHWQPVGPRLHHTLRSHRPYRRVVVDSGLQSVVLGEAVIAGQSRSPVRWLICRSSMPQET